MQDGITLSDFKTFDARYPDSQILRIDDHNLQIIFADRGRRWSFDVVIVPLRGCARPNPHYDCWDCTDMTDSKGNWIARDWSEKAQDQTESVGF